MLARSLARFSLFFTCFGLSLPRAAFSAEPVSDEAQLERTIQSGIAARKAGDDEGALAHFMEAEKRAPESARVLLHVTAAAQATGKWLMAYQYFQRASAHADEPYYQRHRSAIKSIEESLAQRVGRLRVQGSPAGADVRLNGESVGKLPMQEPRAVEVGSYQLEIGMPGYYPLRRPVAIRPGGTLTQEVVELRMLAPPTLSRRPPNVSPARDKSPEAQPVQGWWQSRWVSWALVGARGGAAATSGVAFLIREERAERWNDDASCLDANNVKLTREEVCGNVRDQVILAERIGVTTGVAAATLAGAALAHWLSTPSSEPASSARTARCTPGAGGVVCFGTF